MRVRVRFCGTGEGMLAPAVFRRRSRRGLATSSAASVAWPALPVAATMGGDTQSGRRGGATWSSLPLDGAPGVLALRSLGIRAAGPAPVSGRRSPTCRSPKRPSRRLVIGPGDRSSRRRRAASLAQPPAREPADDGRSGTFRLGFWVCLAVQPLRAGSLYPKPPAYCPGLCLSQVCGHQPVRVPRLETRCTPSAREGLGHQRVRDPFTASGSLRS